MKEFLALAILGVCLWLPSSNAQSDCPEGFVELYADPSVPMGTCMYFAMDRKRTWSEAKDHCASMSASLAMLDPGQLHWEVRKYILGNPAWTDEGYHIGCTDEIQENYWLWVDGTPVVMGPPHWLPGQPDGGTKENYGCIYTPDFYYNSCQNGQTMYAICQL